MSSKRTNWWERHDGREPFPVDDSLPKIPSKKWKEKYECKKNKGDHTAVIKTITSMHNIFLGKIWVIWECTACKKQLWEHSPPQKKFDKYRHSIYEQNN